MKNQKASSSSKNSEKQTTKMDKIEDGQVEKEESQPEFEGQVELEGECFIEQLPQEMQLNIFKYLDITNLISCRLLNWNWNRIASEILRSRSDLELQFNCSKTDNKKQVIIETSRKRSLLDFIKCFAGSKNFPYSRFYFKDVDLFLFANKDWIKFLSRLRDNIKCLKLRAERQTFESGYMLEWTKKLRDVLVHQLPNLEELGLSIFYYGTPNSPAIRLFLTKSVQLPHLKVLYFSSDFSSVFPGIVSDLLKAAVNLKKIESFELPGYPEGIQKLLFLQSLGKLQCVKNTSMQLYPDIFDQIKKKSTAPLDFKLKSLDLKVSSIYSNTSSWSAASIFLSNLFQSSKDTLTKLTTDRMGFFNDLQLPKLSKVADLILSSPYHGEGILEPFLPHGNQFTDIFPALCSLRLVLPWNTAFSPENTISPIPTLKSLVVFTNGINKETIAQVSFMCPNLKEFKMIERGEPINNFHKVGIAIWTHLTKLQSLDMSINVGLPANEFPALDSCITGFSREDCIRLNDVIQANALVEKYGYQVNIPQSELDVKRERHTILDLKELKRLTLRLTCDGDEEEILDEAVTGVSEEYAFKLMDKCHFEIIK